MRVLLQELRRQVQLASSPPDPLADEEVLLPTLPEDLQPDESLEQAHRQRMFRASNPQQGMRPDLAGSFRFRWIDQSIILITIIIQIKLSLFLTCHSVRHRRRCCCCVLLSQNAYANVAPYHFT